VYGPLHFLHNKNLCIFHVGKWRCKCHICSRTLMVSCNFYPLNLVFVFMAEGILGHEKLFKNNKIHAPQVFIA